MESVYSALILHTAGKKITEASIKKILEAAGAKPDDTQIKALVAGLKDKNLDEIIASAAAAPVAAAAPAAAKEEAPKEEKKKDKKKEEKKEEEEPTGIGALFG